MRKFKHTIRNIALLLGLIIAAISCENDFATVESDIVGGDNFNSLDSAFALTTFNMPITPFQTNGLPNYLLGHFNDVFGGSSASIVSQMAPADGNFPIEFDGINISSVNSGLDSIILTIPYFSVIDNIDEDGNFEFDVDSIFGVDPDNPDPIILSVYENRFFLRDFDPNSEFNQSGQLYFSNGSTSPTDIIQQDALEGQLLFRDSSFVIDINTIPLTVTNPISLEDSLIDILTPALRVRLSNPNDNFWENLLFNRIGQTELSNSNNFNNHFRGIYIKAEPLNNNGSMVLFDLSSADSNITFFFTNNIIDDDGNITSEQNTFALNFSGNIVNIFNNNFNPIPKGDDENGDAQLFLKGGEGSMAVINLFNADSTGNSDLLDDFKDFFIDENGLPMRIVNEAFLEFQVDQSALLSSQDQEEPDRVLIYDLNNNVPLIDFFLDLSSTDELIEARNVHLQPLVRENNLNRDGIRYRIRITEHVNNILLRDSTNVKLGLVVTSNVDTPSANIQESQEQVGIGNALVQGIPIGTALSPRGTILFGSNHPDESKRPVFRVFYTEPDNNLNNDSDDND